MGKINVCDLCKKEILVRYEDKAYKFIVKKRWFSYDGFTPYGNTGTIDICFRCMRKIIDATQQPSNKASEPGKRIVSNE